MSKDTKEWMVFMEDEKYGRACFYPSELRGIVEDNNDHNKSWLYFTWSSSPILCGRSAEDVFDILRDFETSRKAQL
jgi:hypothetical protein